MILSLEEFWIQTSSKNKSQWVGGGGCESRSGLREGGKSQWVEGGGKSQWVEGGGESSDAQTLPLNPPLEGGWPYTRALYQT